MFIETFAIIAIILTVVGMYALAERLYRSFDAINK